MNCIVNCNDVILEKHKAVSERFTTIAALNGVRRYNDGLSGAGVYLVSVMPTAQASNGNPRSVFRVLKVDTESEIDAEIEYCNRARELLPPGTIPIIYAETGTVESDGKLQKAILLDLAYDDVREPTSLRDIIPREYDSEWHISIDKAVDAVAGLLLTWNPPSTVLNGTYSPVYAVDLLEQLFSIGADREQSQQAVEAALLSKVNPCDDDDLPGLNSGTPMERRISNLMRRLQCGSVIENKLDREPFVKFNGDPLPLPNPVHYANRLTRISDLRRLMIHPALGWVHGDLHTENVLFDPYSATPQPKWIDFARAGTQKPMLFDWLYLEFDLLYQAANIQDAKSWRHWMQVVKAVTQYDERDRDRTFRDQPIHYIVSSELPPHLKSVVYAVERLRIRADQYWQHEGTNKELLNASFWTCGFYVGLNYARKRVNGRSLKETFRKYAALYFAAHCLRRMLKLSYDQLFNTRSASLIGPHKELFIKPGLNPYPSGVYVSATPDLGGIVEDLRPLGRWRIGSLDPETTNVDDVLLVMRSKQYYLGLIGTDIPEERTISDSRDARLSGDRYTPTEIEGAGALALYPSPVERKVLHMPDWPAWADAQHPLVRHYHQDDFQEFIFKQVDDLEQMRAEIHSTLLDWKVIELVSPINREILSNIPLPNLAETLVALTQDRPQVQVIRLKGADDNANKRLIWRWLRRQIKVQDPTRLHYEAAEIKTEESEISPSFIYNVFNALIAMRSQEDDDWHLPEEVRRRVFGDIEKSLAKKNVYFTIPDLKERQKELAEFCRELSKHLLGKDLPQRVTILVEDKPLPSIDGVIELSTSDLIIPRDVFEAFISKTSDIAWQELLVDRMVPDTSQWTQAIFAAAPQLTMTEFLTQLRLFASRLPNADEKGID